MTPKSPNPALRPLIQEWKAKVIYNCELSELLELGELTEAHAFFIDVQCKQLIARCEAIEKTVHAVQTVDREREGRLDVRSYADHPHLLARVGKINELAAQLQLLNSIIQMIVHSDEVDIEVALYERHATIAQEVQYQHATLMREVDALGLDDDDDDFGSDDWDDNGSDLQDDYSDDDDDLMGGDDE